MLHLANGESTAGTLRQSGVRGTVESADDILMEGPSRNGLSSWAEWEERADYLQVYLAIPRADYLLHTRQRQALLTRALSEDEAVLWFEEDVFCQTNYVQALHWLNERGAARANLTFVCPPAERLGSLEAARLADWFERRQPVTPELLTLAAQAWPVLSGSSPADLHDFIASADFSAWPGLRSGLRAQLARLPQLHNGVNRIEHIALRLIAAGQTRFHTLFARLQEEAPEYGVGDTSVARYLLDLSREPALIVITTNNGPAALLSSSPDWRLQITALGQAVLQGRADYGELAQMDRWLGGLHLRGTPAWRFDPDTQRAVAMS